jgi:long-chain acyl-CoA synthetase
LKQIIVRGGSNISPQEVEEPLYHHPAVLESAVIGMPDPLHGEKVIAFIALRDGFHATEAELRDFVRARIADYKVPERILFLPSLPKGLTGKIQRRELKEMMMLAQQQAATA